MNPIVRESLVPIVLIVGIGIVCYAGTSLSSAHGRKPAVSNRTIDLGAIVVTPDNSRDRKILAEKLMQEHRYAARDGSEPHTKPYGMEPHDRARAAI